MKKLVLTAMFLGFVGCGHKEDSSSSDSASVNPLAGTKWRTECIDSTENEVDFEGSSVDVKAFTYDDATCDTPKILTVAKRAYSVSGQNIDYTFTSVTMTLVVQSDVDNCNQEKCYGKDTWALNVAMDITGKTEGDTVINKAGDKLYNIFKVDGGVLHFGDTTKDGEEGGSLDTRPKDFDTTHPFKKL